MMHVRNTPRARMSTGGRCARRITGSRDRRVPVDVIPPNSCIFSVVYRRASIIRRACTPSASGRLSPRGGRRRRRRDGGHSRAKQKDGQLPARLSVTECAESSVFRLLFRVVVFLARLAVLALQRGAEDVTEAGARIGGAVIGHRLLLLLDLARLDRERQLARRLVDRGD